MCPRGREALLPSRFFCPRLPDGTSACRCMKKETAPPSLFLYVPHIAPYLSRRPVRMVRSSSITAPYSTPATAQMIQLLWGWALPRGP